MATYRNISGKRLMVAGTQVLLTSSGPAALVHEEIGPANTWLAPGETVELTDLQAAELGDRVERVE